MNKYIAQALKSASDHSSPGSGHARLASEVILKAIEDLSVKEQSESAYRYFHSSQFLLHCQLAGIEPTFVLSRKVAKMPEFIEMAFRDKKNRTLIARKKSFFEVMTKEFLNDYETFQKTTK